MKTKKPGKGKIDITQKPPKEALDNFEVKNDNDVQILLGLMAETGTLKETYDDKNKDLMYSLSSSGLKDAEKLLKTDDGTLYMLEVFMGMLQESIPDPHERLMECALFLKKHVGVNLLRVIQRNQKNIKGLRLKDAPESLLKEFD